MEPEDEMEDGVGLLAENGVDQRRGAGDVRDEGRARDSNHRKGFTLAELG
jgi:hypothetical protein